uniref:RRM domain-containing protein n=1 Tax=Anopheles atroparvus TaxID=41427 RepID=A0A182JBZ5_ANOAO
MPHPSAIHPASMHVSAGLPANHFLPSPALASPVGNTAGGNQPPNPPLAANAPCSTLFVANLGQFVSEHELKEIFASVGGGTINGMNGLNNNNNSINGNSLQHINGAYRHCTSHHNLSTISTTNGPALTSTTTSAIAAAACNGNGIHQHHHLQHHHSNGSALANGVGASAPVPVAFVEFKDVVSAAAAMAALQGKFLLSSDRGAMRIEFAKSKMAADIPSHQFYAQNHAQQREHIQPVTTTIMNHSSGISNGSGPLCMGNTTSNGAIMNGGVGAGAGLHGRGGLATSMGQNAGLFTFAVAHPRA